MVRNGQRQIAKLIILEGVVGAKDPFFEGDLNVRHEAGDVVPAIDDHVHGRDGPEELLGQFQGLDAPVEEEEELEGLARLPGCPRTRLSGLPRHA